MNKDMSESEIAARFSQINALPPEELSPEEEASLSAAQAVNDGTTVSLEDFKAELEQYSGKLVLRIPRILHKMLKEQAEFQGVSLNQYLVFCLSESSGRFSI